MSKTFTSNPSHMSRGRGAESNRGGNVLGRGTGQTARVVGTGRSNSTFTSQHTQGPRRGHPAMNSSHGSSYNNSSSSMRGRGGLGSNNRGRMEYTGAGPDRGRMQGQREDAQEKEGNVEGSGQHAGGYTMFSPNEKRRQKVNQMAQRETQAYERYKRANSTKTYNYVGTVGGGEINEEQARARQAQQVRAAKFNRQMKQEQHRQIMKKAEEDAIQAKRDEARRKAELNAQRQARAAPAEEVRRNREAFLAQFEKNSQGNTAASPGQDQVESLSSVPSKPRPRQQLGSNYNNNNGMSPGGRSQAHSSGTPPGASKAASSNAQGVAAATRGSGGGRKVNLGRASGGPVTVKTEPQVFQTGETAGARSSAQQPPTGTDVKTEGTAGEPE